MREPIQIQLGELKNTLASYNCRNSKGENQVDELKYNMPAKTQKKQKRNRRMEESVKYLMNQD